MRDLIDALYTYAQENRIPDYLQTGEYRRVVYGLEEGLEAFRSTLTAEQSRELDTLLSQKTRLTSLRVRRDFWRESQSGWIWGGFSGLL